MASHLHINTLKTDTPDDFDALNPNLISDLLQKIIFKSHHHIFTKITNFHSDASRLVPEMIDQPIDTSDHHWKTCFVSKHWFSRNAVLI